MFSSHHPVSFRTTIPEVEDKHRCKSQETKGEPHGPEFEWHVLVLVYVHIKEKPGNSDKSCHNEHLQGLNYGLEIPFSSKRNQDFLEKWLSLDLGREM